MTAHPETEIRGDKKEFDSFNSFLLDGSLDRFTKLLARYELFKQIVDIPGDIVECGVFKGMGLLYWARLVQIFNPMSLRRVVGFDTFDGYPEALSRAGDRAAGLDFISEAGSKGTRREHLVEVAAKLHLRERIEIVEGDASLTMAAYVRNNPGFRIALLNLDFDVYEPTAAALDAFYELVVPNGMIVFDEYATRPWGESDAADAFFKDKRVEYKSFPWALSPTAFVRKSS